MSRRVTTVLGLALASALSLASPMRPSALLADDCGHFSGKECSHTEACVNILFYKMCTTKYKYYRPVVE
jgi:hypothetical protein